MNTLNSATRTQVIRCLVEGNSVRATARLTGVQHKTVLRLLVNIGEVCRQYQNEHLKGLHSKRVQIDEIWSFCYAKEKNVPSDKKGTPGFGDVWTYTAIDADSKLIISWQIGDKSIRCATNFVVDVESRLSERIQLTTDGNRAYLVAVDRAFGIDVDYAVLHKVYGTPPGGSGGRYSPMECIGVKTQIVMGDPDHKHISTSYVERSNLSMRMQMRRFTRLTNGFSKKLSNHAAAIALYFMFYNFARVHQTLRITPAMAAGVTDHVWEIEDIANLFVEQPVVKRGPYKKKSA